MIVQFSTRAGAIPVPVLDERVGTAILVFVTLLWGSTFVVIKYTVEGVSVPALLAYRFTLALTLLGWIRPPKSALVPGLLLGLLMFAGYASQTFGLAFTSASNAAFITGLSVILTPTLGGLLFRHRVPIRSYLAAMVAVSGIGLLTLPTMGGVNAGDLCVLGTAFALALHTLYLGRVSSRHSPLALTAVQLWPVVFFSWGWLLLDRSAFTQVDVWGSLGILYLAVVGVASLGLQVLAQRVVPAHKAAVVLGLEPLFGAIFAGLLLQEVLGAWGWFGGVLVVLGMTLTGSRRPSSRSAHPARTSRA